MSYDIYLKDPVTKKTIIFDFVHQMAGGTRAIGGTNEAWLNITYNYSRHFYKHLDSDDGIRTIYGKTGAETIPLLQAACDKLGDDMFDNYWLPTEGNAKQALKHLIAFAQLRPDGVWNGD
jgi:hypothetical protein